MKISFFKATTPQAREAINTFLTRHNARGKGSTVGYVAYYAAVADGSTPLLEHIIATAKFCPLHTPNAARLFAGDDWRSVYCLQRLAAYRAPASLLSRFLAWSLKQMTRDTRVHYVATYADTGTIDPRTGRPHSGGIYRATNAIYCGMTQGRKIEGFVRDGQRRSLRRGARTWTVRELRHINKLACREGKPEPIKLIRSKPKHRYCWALGTSTKLRRQRRRQLERRMAAYRFTPAQQLRLWFKQMRELWCGMLDFYAARLTTY